MAEVDSSPSVGAHGAMGNVPLLDSEEENGNEVYNTFVFFFKLRSQTLIFMGAGLVMRRSVFINSRSITTS